MAKYLVTWQANPAVWPVDPKQALAVLEGAIGGGDMLLKSGSIKEMGWLTGQQGFAIFEADSKAAVLGLTEPFFPFYLQEVREIVPWADANEAILASARQAASR